MDSILTGLAANPALPATLLDRLIEIADDRLAGELADRRDLGRAQVRALAERSGSAAIRLARSGVLDAADVDPVTRPDVALALIHEGRGLPGWPARFATDPVPERRASLAGCPGLPPDVEAALAGDAEPGVVAELARGTRTAELLARLAAHPHLDVRGAVAGNPRTPPAVLADLAAGAEPGSWIRLPLAENPATPVGAVARFVDDPFLLVRSALAGRTDLPPEVAGALAEDPLPGVRGTLAANPAIGVEVIRQLATCRMYDVQRRLAHHPDVPLDVLTYLAGEAKIGPHLLPRIDTAGPDEIERLASSAQPVIRMLLAARPDLPAAVRDRLAADPDPMVLRSIAADPGLTEPQLRDLVARHGTRVLAKVATNPGASAALLADLARHEPPVRRAFRSIARHPHATAPALLRCLDDVDARPIAARHPSLPPEVIVELLGDPRADVAEAAAANPSLPVEAMTASVERARQGLGV